MRDARPERMIRAMKARPTGFRAGIALAAAIAGIAVASPAVVLPRAPTSAANTDGPCVLDASRDAAPRQVRFKGETTVTLAVKVSCDPARRPLHVVLVIDASRAMAGERLDDLKFALVDAVKSLALGERPWVRIGVVAFTGVAQARVLYPFLTNDAALITAAVNNIDTDGSACPPNPDFECGPSVGLREALNLLRTARDAGADPREVIVLATAGDYEPVCDGIRQRATEIQQFGALLVTACAGDPNACERRCLRDVVTHDRFYFRSQRWAYFDRVLGQLIDAIGPFNPIERVTIVDNLADALLYVGSDDPGIRVDGGRLTWEFQPHTMNTGSWAITRTYRVQAVDCGQIQSSRDVTATLRYNAPLWGGQARTFGLPNPVLVVPCPTVTPTATPIETPSPTPDASTSTATATAPTPSATPTADTPPTPSAVPTRRWSAYLPRVARYACVGDVDDAPWDAVLAIDVSGSMERPAGGADRRSRWEAARDIALQGVIAQALSVGIDRVAVVQFGREGEVLAELGPCCDAAQAALAGLGNRDWSYPWSALDRAVALLQAAPRPATRRAIILFTDLAPGDLSPADADLLQARAGAARAAGVDLFAVGLGDDADAAAISRLAGTARRVYLTRAMVGADPPNVVGRSLRCWR